MKYTLYLLICLTVTQPANAQTKFSIQSEAGLGFMFHKFTRDELLPNARKGNLTGYAFTYTNLLGVVTTKNNKWQFLAGIGVAGSSLSIVKVSDAEGLIELLTFSWLFDDSYPDSYPYTTIKIKNRSLAVPFGFAYNVLKNPSGKSKFLLGLRTSLNFPVRKDVTISFADPSLTSADKEMAKATFASLITPTVSIMPTVSYSEKLSKNFDIDYTIIPVILFTKSQYQKIFTKQTGGSFQLSVRYTF